MIRSLADRVILADGAGRAAFAFGAGAVGALAMPPLGLWPALAVSLSAAVWLLDGSQGGRGLSRTITLRRAAVVGWWWGFGYFVAGLWWIGAAFLVEADTFAWLMPVGILGLPALLAFFPALAFALARAAWSRGGRRIFVLAAALTASEWLRGHLLTGFPWNPLGLAFGQNPLLMQAASVLGQWGLTLLAALVLASPAMLATAETPAGRYVPGALALAAVAALAAFGAWRLSAGEVPSVPGVKLRIMQPNLAQDAKFRPANGPEILRKYLALSDGATSPDRAGMADVTHLVWPESAFPFLLHREPVALARIADLLPKGGALITGAARQGEALPGEVGGRYYNAVQVVDSDGAISATYDKVHLVPFGEYVPHALDAALRSLGIRQFVAIPGGFTPGERHRSLKVEGLPLVAPSICYEAIFPDEAIPPGPRPGLILNVTNDGWFGTTAGPHQHLALARLRAVEQGLPLVRAANTGISAVVDPYGRILAALPLGQEGVLDAALPVALAPTLFARFGDGVPLVLVVMCGGLGLWRARPGRRRSDPP